MTGVAARQASGATRSALDVTGVLVEFARTLRHAGLDVPEQRVRALLEAVDALDVADPRDTYWAGRATLCASREDIDVYDAAFVAFFRGVAPLSLLPRKAPLSLPRLTLPFGAGGSTADNEAYSVRVAAIASDVELLRQRDIGSLTPAERDEVRRMIALLAVGAASRPSRRWQPGRRGAIDPGRTVRAMLRGGGEPVRPLWRGPRPKPRRLVILIDVSGSMAPYADALLCFGHAAVRRAPNRTEVFTIGTRVTRVTRALRHRDPDAALRAAGAAVPDWHGGTRLADSVKAFLDRWGRRGMARGAIVVICSDGWERGDPAPLAAQVSSVTRLAHRVVWVSPHQGKPGYEPIAAGIAACVPLVDEFVGGHTMEALERLTHVIAGRDLGARSR